MRVGFFQKALEYQQVHGRGHRIINTIQTNGTLLDDAWCEFFHRYGFLVGISLDGPRESHDRYRKTIGGQGTFETVMRGIELLQQHRVEFNILCAVNDYNARRPLKHTLFSAVREPFYPVYSRSGTHNPGRPFDDRRWHTGNYLVERHSPRLGAIPHRNIFPLGQKRRGGYFRQLVRRHIGPDTWGPIRGIVTLQKNAAMPWLWNTTATYMPATISSFPNTSEETS